MKIRERLSLQFSLLAFALLFAAAAILYYFASDSAGKYFENLLRQRALTTFSYWSNVVSRDSTNLSLIERNRKNRLPAEKTVIMEANGRILYNSNDSIFFPPLVPLLQKLKTRKELFFDSEEHHVIGTRLNSASGEQFFVFTGARPDDNTVWLQQLRFLMVSIFVMMIAIIALTGWWFSSSALKPIKKTIQDIQDIPATDLKGRLSGGDSVDEIGELVRIFNDLLSRIENSVNLQKTFVANVSHELKNPITKIMSQIEVTLLREREDETYRQILKSILEDIREMNLLTQSLLDLSIVRHDPTSYNFMSVRIDEILWDVRDQIHELPQGYRVDFAILSAPDDEEKMVVSGNPYLLRTAFKNLIENAGKYSDDKFIDVVMNCAIDHIEIVISNQGPGIPADKLPFIFDFGKRVDQVKSTTGYGIGLPLAQRILKIHNATIRIESDPGNLTKVFVVFQF